MSDVKTESITLTEPMEMYSCNNIGKSPLDDGWFEPHIVTIKAGSIVARATKETPECSFLGHYATTPIGAYFNEMRTYKN